MFVFSVSQTSPITRSTKLYSIVQFHCSSHNVTAIPFLIDRIPSNVYNFRNKRIRNAEIFHISDSYLFHNGFVHYMLQLQVSSLSTNVLHSVGCTFLYRITGLILNCDSSYLQTIVQR